MDSIRSFKIRLGILIAGMLVIIMPVVLFAQTANIPYHMVPYPLSSGVYEGDQESGEAFTLMYSEVVQLRDIPWLRLMFRDAHLGKKSYLVITSLKDGAYQRLNARTLAQWQFTSAYFNGSAVRLELYVFREDKGVYVQLEEVMAGDYVQNLIIESQCGPTDDRIPSNHPAAGRLMNIGCTAWIITNGRLVSAGHCLDGSGATVMEFNVPLSLPNGTLQHPGPDDQYAVDISSKVYTNGGIGNDWGVFEVFDNSNTGLQPIAAQGAAFTVVQNLLPDSIRITGYGVDYDDPILTQTQQTHVGPNVGSSGTTMRYQTDTEGGNSGSPVIDNATGFAVGVHTHGGCQTSGGGNNNGTSTYNTAFWSALGTLAPFPEGPINLTAYSDYTMPNSMELVWEDPTHFITGDTMLAYQFSIQIKRDDVWIDSVSGGVQQYVDSGLNDGQEYTYQIYARVKSSGLESESTTASWIAGGSPIPTPPTEVNIFKEGSQVRFAWRNPARNIDGTPMDDLAGVNLYQDSLFVASFSRTSADTGRLDSASYTVTDSGFHSYYLTVYDNESPSHESEPSVSVITPLDAPLADNFSVMGDPDPQIWYSSGADVNDRSSDPPSGPYALNFNGKPSGGDVLELYPVNLSGYQGSGMIFSYYYQPQGLGNVPEPGDSLLIYFRNSLGDWILVRGYPGSPLQPFAQEVIDLETVPAGGGSYFHSQFQVRIRSIGSQSLITPNDDWFVDNILLGFASATIGTSPDTLSFDSTQVNASAQADLTVHNYGLDSLRVSGVYSSNSVFAVDSSGFVMESGGVYVLSVSFTPLQVGSYSGWISLVSNDPSKDTLDVVVRGVAVGPSGLEDGEVLIGSYAVHQNYPNPFNPVTTIYYQLPRRSEVSLEVYNLLGQKVRTLVKADQEAGRYRAVWDARNDAGTLLGSGIYIYRFRAGNYSRVMKMILLK